MSQALYRKYRPHTFDELVGQNHIKITLQNELKHGQVAHAYLFSGPRGVGKTTTARLLALSINCPEGKKSPLYEEFISGRAADLIEIDAASHTGVDNVRENIIENARFTPQRAQFKVFIIDEVHMLSTSAFNALLKTLEEPPEHVIFILATTEIHRVPETIISRCQRFDFKRVSVAAISERLWFLARQEEISIDDEVLETIARLADGSVRDGEVLLGQVMSLGEQRITMESASLVIPRSDNALLLEFFQVLLQCRTAEGLAIINKIIEGGVELSDFVKEFIELLRRSLLLKLGYNDALAAHWDANYLAEIKKLLELVNAAELTAMIERFLQAHRGLKNTPIPQLSIELAVVEICQGGEESSSSIANRTIPQDAPVSSSVSYTQSKTSSESRPAVPAAASSAPARSKSSLAKKTKILPARANKHTAVALEAIRKKWPAVIERLRRQNHSLGISIQGGVPLRMEQDTLVIGFRYSFHAERAGEHHTRRAIEDALEAETKSKLAVRALTVEAEEFEQARLAIAEQAPTPAVVNITEALNVFGGEVVEEEN